MRSAVVTGLVSGALLIPGIVLGGEFDSVEVGYVDVATNDGSGTAQGDGYRIKVSKELGKRFFVHGNYDNVKYASTVDGSSVKFGVGYQHAFGTSPGNLVSRYRFVGTASYVDYVEPSGVGNEDNGLELASGIRARITLPFEIGASLNVKFNKDGTDTGVGLLGRWHFAEDTAVSLETVLGDNIDTITLGVRLNF